ncbi:MAG: translation initiation factor IF-1 [Promethearchaeota archaeon]|jgi:translation initiation factor IF-1
MSDKGYVEVEGEVIGALPNAMFKVMLDAPLSKVILCHISGKIRKNFINIVPGDRVKVSVSLVDPSQGRITFRTRK